MPWPARSVVLTPLAHALAATQAPNSLEQNHHKMPVAPTSPDGQARHHPDRVRRCSGPAFPVVFSKTVTGRLWLGWNACRSWNLVSVPPPLLLELLPWSYGFSPSAGEGAKKSLVLGGSWAAFLLVRQCAVVGDFQTLLRLIGRLTRAETVI